MVYVRIQDKSIGARREFSGANFGRLVCSCDELELCICLSLDKLCHTCVMAVRLGGEARQRTVGVAYAEPAERRLGVAEYLDNDEFSNLEVMCLKDLVLE